ncbi:hypothetical protein HGRIS_012520 [Hohenbuehelia grisea]|uniref:Ricin B lectin domain-containing protein n=1 Tax=Hohenbuehelia grisea TaxID=104357 RepID=A0ABR3ISH6_9AGAR
MDTIPTANVLYRIQSGDFGAYLELYDVNSKDVVLRPKNEALLQQWIFVAIPGTPGVFNIMNAATQSLRRTRYLNIPTTGLPSARVAQAPFTTQQWTVREETGGLFSLTIPGADDDSEVFLHTTKTGDTGSTELPASNTNVLARNSGWRILEVNPGVRKEKYRIRTLNGGALQLQHNVDQITVDAVSPNGSSHEWQVEPHGNGKCTIMNIAEKAYLGWEPSKNGFVQVAKSPSPLTWIIKSLGEYAYSINLNYSLDATHVVPLVLTFDSNNAVLLKPKKVAQNRIWIFEEADAPKKEEPAPPPPYQPSTTRYSEITGKAYFIKNIGTSQYIYVASSPWRFYPGGRSYQISLAYIAGTATFTLVWSSSYYLSTSGDLLTVSNTTDGATQWILERDNDPAGGYCYSICLASNPSMALSGDTRTDINGYPLFTVVTKSKGYTRHQWKFEV